MVLEPTFVQGDREGEFLLAAVDCFVDGGIEKGDGGSATGEDFENVQKKLKEALFAVEHPSPG